MCVWYLNHYFTSHYSSSWDVQIDRILHTLITYSYQGVALFRLSSGSSTSGRVACAQGLPSSIFVFSFFYWSGVVTHKAWIRFLKVMLSCLRLFHFRWVICHFVALACLHVDLFGVEPHHLKDSFFLSFSSLLHALVQSIF